MTFVALSIRLQFRDTHISSKHPYLLRHITMAQFSVFQSEHCIKCEMGEECLNLQLGCNIEETLSG